MELYPWQKKAIDKWINTSTEKSLYGAKGIIKAVTGAGKSLVGQEIIKKFLPLKENERIVITCYSDTILNQWKIILDGIPQIDYFTHQKLHTMDSIKYPYKVRLLMIDEVHRSVSPEYSKIYNVLNYDNILALSATPTEECNQYAGDILIDVSFDEATISPFYVEFHGVNLLPNEHYKYSELSYSIASMYKHQTENMNKQLNEKMYALIMKRRSIVYTAKNRIIKAVDLISREYCLNKKILVITQRIEQANEIYTRINNIIPCTIYHSENLGNINDYKTGKTKVLITVGMAKEGFNDEDTDCGIIVSTPLSESFHIQAIGRIIRFKPGKIATIHILLANNTTDMEVLKYTGNYDFNLNNINSLVTSETKDLKREYYSGEKFSFCENRVWKKVGFERKMYKWIPELNILKTYKPEGGSFVLTNNKLLIKTEQDIKIVLENCEIKLEQIK